MKKKYFIILFIFTSILCFFIGYRTAIKFRYNVQKKMLPLEIADKYSVYFDPQIHKNPYIEAFKRYLISTKEEYSKYKMETLFNIETKYFIEWFIKNQKPNSKILDIGGATGLQWKTFKGLVEEKNLSIFLVEIDKKSIEIGKKNYANERLKLFHVSELDKITHENIDTIFMCEVYMQIPNAPQVFRNYLDRYPNSKAVVIHSSFEDKIPTKIFSFFKKNILRFVPIIDCLQGRAMTDKIFYSEMESVNLKIIKEYDITNLSKHSRPLRGKVKAYIIKRKEDIKSVENK
ncbi:MAG: class I SAM-dependent methyltransferase [Bacteroidetes bacterium]|nr:class I SAM-dependent methyltransferase [Bacteroidota bacterium]